VKKAGPVLGYVQVEYYLKSIFDRCLQQFKDADSARINADKEYEDSGQEPKLIQPLMVAQARRTEAGVVLLVVAGSLLEQVIYNYATTFLDDDWYEDNLGNLRIVTKYVVLPRLCQNKQISDDDPAINSLKEFVKARNAVVHPKRERLSEAASKRTETEVARFVLACRNVETTVTKLIKLLESPAPK
jgi:hypothetical protein